MIGADFQQLGKRRRVGRDPAVDVEGVASVVSSARRHDVLILTTGGVELGRCRGSQPPDQLPRSGYRASDLSALAPLHRWW
jgi:hypothetical protein